jgi:hypothetical protein
MSCIVRIKLHSFVLVTEDVGVLDRVGLSSILISSCGGKLKVKE